jgi:hypothetical protein
VQPSFADIGSIFTATIPFVAEELRSISMRCWQTWHWKKATKGSLKPSNYGFDPIRPRNVMANCLTEFSRVWAYNPTPDPAAKSCCGAVAPRIISLPPTLPARAFAPKRADPRRSKNARKETRSGCDMGSPHETDKMQSSAFMTKCRVQQNAEYD